MAKDKKEYEESVATGIELTNRMMLEKPSEDYVFDIRDDFVQAVSKHCDVQGLVEQTKGKSSEGMKEVFSNFGKSLMNAVIDLADGEYRDRSAEIGQSSRSKSENTLLKHRCASTLWGSTSRFRRSRADYIDLEETSELFFHVGVQHL